MSSKKPEKFDSPTQTGLYIKENAEGLLLYFITKREGKLPTWNRAGLFGKQFEELVKEWNVKLEEKANGAPVH